jgi:hypothetical protein
LHLVGCTLEYCLCLFWQLELRMNIAHLNLKLATYVVPPSIFNTHSITVPFTVSLCWIISIVWSKSKREFCIILANRLQYEIICQLYINIWKWPGALKRSDRHVVGTVNVWGRRGTVTSAVYRTL